MDEPMGATSSWFFCRRLCHEHGARAKWACACACVRACVCTCVRVYVYMCICVYVCVRVCVHVCVWTRTDGRCLDADRPARCSKRRTRILGCGGEGGGAGGVSRVWEGTWENVSTPPAAAAQPPVLRGDWEREGEGQAVGASGRP